jgi:hypothetical protein
MDDVATALTESLDRNGRGGMLAPFRFQDGTVTQPSVTWIGQTNLGFYRAGSNDQRATVNGVDAMRWIDDGGSGAKSQVFDDSDSLWKDVAHENSVIRLGNGAIDAPALTWFADVANGFYRAGAGDERYVQAAADIMQFLSGKMNVMSERYDTTPGAAFTEMVAKYLNADTKPADLDDKSANVADTAFVRARSPIAATGRGDGNSSTFLGQAYGGSGWAYNAVGDYTLTLANPLTNANNAVVIAQTVESSTVWLFVTRAIARSTTIVDIEAGRFDQVSQLFEPANPDSISFLVIDTGLMVY